MAEHHAHAHENKELSATEVLEEEHRVIERMLNALARLSVQLGEGKTPPDWVLTDASDFISDFADGCHHAKEEHRMFPMLETAGMPVGEGPIPVMLMEHEQGREWNRRLRAAGERLASGDESARQDVIEAIAAYIGLLRAHIKKEDNALFPMADRILTPPQQDALLEEFEQLEREETGEGVHDKYLGVLERIEEAVAK